MWNDHHVFHPTVTVDRPVAMPCPCDSVRRRGVSQLPLRIRLVSGVPHSPVAILAQNPTSFSNAFIPMSSTAPSKDRIVFVGHELNQHGWKFRVVGLRVVRGPH